MPTKPESPKYLKAFPVDGGKVRLIWDQSPSKDVYEYQVFIGRQGRVDYSMPVATVDAKH